MNFDQDDDIENAVERILMLFLGCSYLVAMAQSHDIST